MPICITRSILTTQQSSKYNQQMTYNYSMVISETFPNQNHVLSGIEQFPFTQNILINTNKLAQAESRIEEIAEPMFHGTREKSVETRVFVTGVALARLKLFGIYYGSDVSIRSAPLKAYHLLVPLKGSISSTTHGKSVKVTPGTAILCRAGTCLQMDWEAECLVLLVIISKAEFEKVLHGYSPLDPPGERHISEINLKQGQGKSLANLLNCLCIECNNQHSDNSLDTISEGLQKLLLIALSQIYSKIYNKECALSGTARRRKGVARALDYIHQNTHRCISLGELAKAAYLSPRSLQTGFKESFNLGPMTYSKQLRLARAHEALGKNAAQSISEIALQYGFDNPGSFTRLYKKRYGVYPSVTLHGVDKEQLRS